jgi:Transposase DDE domain
VLSVDGTTLDVQDTEANWARFGGPGTRDESGAGLRGGFPKVRVVALAECGTRALIAARQGSYATSEKALTVELLPLLDTDTANAAELYHARWQIENAFGAFKSQLKGDGVVLRSKTPDGAEQELWALLCAYHAIRELICAAAELTDQDPLRLSFIAALDAVRGPIGDPAAFPP